MWIIGFSLSMDLLIIGMMSLNNSFVFMPFHPLAYIVKLNIEMSMAELVAKVSISSNNQYTNANDLKRMNSLTCHPSNNHALKHKLDDWSGSLSSFDMDRSRTSPHAEEIMVSMKREVHVQVERRMSIAASLKEQKSIAESTSTFDNDRLPLKEKDVESTMMTRREYGMGMYTKVWGP